MAVSEMNYFGGGGGELSTTKTEFSSQTSVTINCEIGDIIDIVFTRSAAQGISWNGISPQSNSPDFIDYYAVSTNTIENTFKASQTTNTFAIAGGATISGCYNVITVQ